MINYMAKNLVVKKAGKKGKGVFALRNFKEGDVILHVDLTKNKNIVSKEDVPKLSKEDRNHTTYIGRGKYLIDYSTGSLINHSCNPNTFCKNKRYLKCDIVAIKDIKKGGEITFDYSIGEMDEWKMKCYCGSKNCRKIIYGNFFKLPKKLQLKYILYLSPLFRRKHKNNLDTLVHSKK